MAALRELERIADQVDQHLPQPGRVADHEMRQVAPVIDAELHALCRRLFLEQAGHVFDRGGQREVDLLDRELARLDLGKIQQVVDDRQQRLRIVLPPLDLLARPGLQRPVAQREAQHADHAGQRRAHLVAHVGQEFGLLPRGVLGPLRRMPEPLVALFEFVLLLHQQPVLHLHLGRAQADLLLQAHALAAQHAHAAVIQAEGSAQQQQQRQRAEPPGAPERRQDRDRQLGRLAHTPSLLAAFTRNT
jgi:hypothetical protein